MPTCSFISVKVSWSTLSTTLISDVVFLFVAVAAIASLVVHSIDEDEQGVVQRSFEDVVGSLLAASLALDEFAKGAYGADPGGHAPPAVLALGRALDRALYRIVARFYPFLKEFAFPAEYAQRLRQYADFQH